MGKVKHIDMKNRTYYFYSDVINIEECDSNFLKIDTKSYKDTTILIFTVLGISQLKKLVIVKIFTV